MFQKSTFFMRAIIILLGLAVFAPSVLLFPRAFIMFKGAVEEIGAQSTEVMFFGIYLVLFIAIYVALVPFFTALYQTLKLLDNIDKKETFSEKSTKALKIIRNCAIAIFAIYLVGIMPMVVYFARFSEAPETIIIWAAFSLVPLAIAVFASMLRNLIQEAIYIKSENDLTI